MAKAPLEIRSLARRHCARAIQVLAGIMDSGAEEADRIRAAQALIDRGYGKAAQPIGGAEELGPITVKWEPD